MTSCTISEALLALKQANADEIRDEIGIIEEEIADLRAQIVARKRMIGSIRRFAGVKAPGKTAAKGTPSAKSAIGLARWQQIQQLLKHSGPMRNVDIAKHFGINEAGTHAELKKRSGHAFEQLDDGRWKVKGS